MAKELKNILFLAVIGLFCTYYYLDVQTLPQPEERNLVTFLVWGIAIFLILEIARSIYRGVKNRKKEDSSFLKDIIDWIKDRQAILMVSVILYVILLPIIGFFVTSLIFVVSLNYLLESRKIWELTIIPVGLMVLIYVLFVTLLGINLPTGVLI